MVRLTPHGWRVSVVVSYEEGGPGVSAEKGRVVVRLAPRACGVSVAIGYAQGGSDDSCSELVEEEGGKGAEQDEEGVEGALSDEEAKLREEAISAAEAICSALMGQMVKEQA